MWPFNLPSLRDSLAQAAMQSFLSHPEKHGHTKHSGLPKDPGIAMDAYSVADYMLEARKKPLSYSLVTLATFVRDRCLSTGWCGLLAILGVTFFIGWVLAPLVAWALVGWRA